MKLEITHTNLFLNRKDNASLRAEIEDAIQTVIDSGQYKHKTEEGQKLSTVKVAVEINP